MDDEANLIKSDEDRRQRVSLLAGAAFVPLESYRRNIAAVYGPTPHFDPLDGGTAASLLLLLETPGPGMDNPRFVSRDNPAGTARNIGRFMQRARIRRRRTILWNTVPWIIHAAGARNRPPDRREIDTGLILLPGLVRLLPGLRVVVAAGRTAALAVPIIREVLPQVTVLAMPHPSPTYVNTSPSVAERIEATLVEAATHLPGAETTAQSARPHYTSSPND